MFRISAVSAVRCLRLMKVGLSLNMEFVRLIRLLESDSLTISEEVQNH